MRNCRWVGKSEEMESLSLLLLQLNRRLGQLYVLKHSATSRIGGEWKALGWETGQYPSHPGFLASHYRGYIVPDHVVCLRGLHRPEFTQLIRHWKHLETVAVTQRVVFGMIGAFSRKD